MFQPPKKAGVSLYVTKKPASKSAKVFWRLFCNLVFLIFNLHFHFLKATEEESVEDENDQEDDSRKRAASSEPEENDNGEPEAKKTATENNGVEADAAAGRPKRATRKT